MTKALINKLIKHYEGVIGEIRTTRTKDIEDIYLILQRTKTACGICACAEELFGIRLYRDKWVSSFRAIDKCLFWFSTIPINYTTKRGVLLSLRKRVKRMKTYILSTSAE